MGKNNKIKPPVNYDFESSNNRYDFTKICRDMMKSKAWSELSLRQRRFIFTSKIKVHSEYKDIRNKQK